MDDSKKRFITFFMACLVLNLSLIANAAPKLTIYDDGLSCPSNCDAHVVMHADLNGTVFAHLPSSTSSTPISCEVDSPCRICFDNEGNECLVTVYRGAGPGRNTFDFTPAFFDEWCKKNSLPKALKEKCDELQQMSKKLDGRVNCIRDPDHELCIDLVRRATETKQRDALLYQICVKLGQSAFNGTRDTSEKRTHACTYEYVSTGGPNSRGLRWKRLKPAACRKGTFVGRDGLDCCSGKPFVDATLGIECKLFYPTLH